MSQSIDRFDCKTWAEVFNAIKNPRTPFVTSTLDLGNCLKAWQSPDYLKSKVPKDQLVPLHVAKSNSTNLLDFTAKNFEYQNSSFHDFIDKITQNRNSENSNTIYLRSTATKNFRKNTANMNIDFPELAKDINLPEFPDIKQDFSSVLRISSGKTQVWSHYDTVDNFLIQILGEKEVFLAHPECAERLKLKVDSDKPDVVDPWSEKEDLDIGMKFVLKPGDVLFL